MSEKLRVVNLGISSFYDALTGQNCDAAQIDWHPPVKISDELRRLLAKSLEGALGAKVDAANEAAADMIIEADPAWVDVKPAGEVIEGLGDYTVTHSGPPISFENMVRLHQRGMVSACLFEGWAKTEEEALRLIHSGKIKMISALDTNTVGAGTGIITKNVAMIVIKDRNNGKVAATFPAEGIAYQGGFCGWGLYSEGIAENLRNMREYLLPPMAEVARRRGGIPIKPILAESMAMGDENHTRQSAADLLFEHQITLDMMQVDYPKQQILDAMKYIIETPRFFHCFGQGASRAAMLGNVGRAYSTMVTAVCGNGVEFGIKIAAMGDTWFTAPAPMMQGKYTSSKYTINDQLPWCGDSCVVECAGLGGMAAAASPIVCNLRGMKLKDAIAQTREMEKICIKKNYNYPIPNLDFDFLPVGVDIRKVLQTGIAPVIHGGMFNKEGGLIGAGMARVPMECFEKAMRAFMEKYGAEA